MVLHLMHRRRSGEQVVEVPPPAGRVVAGARLDRRGVVHYRLDALTHPARGLSLRGPDRLQHVQNSGGVYGLHVKRAKLRIGIRLERGAPLRRMRTVRACLEARITRLP